MLRDQGVQGFERPSIDVIAGARCDPARILGEPVNTFMCQTIQFSLGHEGD